VKEVIKKAAVLIEAMPYIQRFRGALVVVKLGGSALEDRSHMESILADVTFMECVGMRPVIVHGGGKAISRAMKASGIEPRFHKGLRITCEKSVQVVQRVLNEEVNPAIVAALARHGARAQGVFGETLLKVRRKTDKDPETGEVLDWGFVGEPDEVDAKPIVALARRDVIPVVTPLGRGPDGKVHNVNADTAAAAMAKAMKARKLAYVSDVPGLLRDPADEGSLIPTVRADEVAGLARAGIIDGGMLPKMDSAVEALRAGVGKIHMIDGRMPHSLLLEIFTDKGVGTEIVAEPRAET
jgi:acetylglutamate kinase